MVTNLGFTVTNDRLGSTVCSPEVLLLVQAAIGHASVIFLFFFPRQTHARAPDFNIADLECCLEVQT